MTGLGGNTSCYLPLLLVNAIFCVKACLGKCWRFIFVYVLSSTGVARDVLRNVTYVLRNNGRIGVVRDGIYSFLFERSNVESLVVDWVANVLYWIEGGTMVSSESVYVNTYLC